MDLNQKQIDALKKNVRWKSIIESAKFGERVVEPYIDQITSKGRILEIGCGTGLLLHALSEKNQNLEFEGIEAYGDGFNDYADIGVDLETTNLFTVFKEGYENYSTEKNRFDLIYSINTVEHLSDWRSLISFIFEVLGENGVAVLCFPNYSFPYESHFRIPILINKKITGSIYRKHIRKIESNEDGKGLWNSLNFVKVNEVIDECKKTGLQATIHFSVIRTLLTRLETDQEFYSRHKNLRVATRIFDLLRLENLFKLRWLSLRLPYIQLEIKKQVSESKRGS